MATTPLDPWDHSVLYNWLMSLAYHGLRQKRNESKDLVGTELTSKETEVRFDPNWTELPSLDLESPENLVLVAWGSEKIVAVDSNFEEANRSASIKAWFLDLKTPNTGWIAATSSHSVENMQWERPRCSMIGNRLYVIFPQLTSPRHENDPMKRIFAVHSIELLDDPHQPSSGWTISESDALVSDQNLSAATCVKGHQIIFVLKRWSLDDIAKGALVYDTVSKRWSTLPGATPETIDGDGDYSGRTVSVDSSFLICPHFAEEHSCCYAVSLVGMDRSFVMADYQENLDELMHEEDQDGGDIPWSEEHGEMCDFGAFVSCASLYTFPHHMHGFTDEPCNYFVRRDFSTRSCHYDEDDDRVWFRPLSKVPFPDPLFRLDPSVMVKVGKWWVSSGEANTLSSGKFQAIAVHDQLPIPSESSKSNFVHLGLQYYDKCIDTLWEEPADENGNPRTRINTKEPRKYLSFLLALDPTAVFERNENGKLPFELALDNPCVDGRMLRTILRANPGPLLALNLPPSLFPHILFSLQRRDGRWENARSLESAHDIYTILRQQPDLVDSDSQGTTSCGGTGKRKRE